MVPRTIISLNLYKKPEREVSLTISVTITKDQLGDRRGSGSQSVVLGTQQQQQVGVYYKCPFPGLSPDLLHLEPQHWGPAPCVFISPTGNSNVPARPTDLRVITQPGQEETGLGAQVYLTTE